MSLTIDNNLPISDNDNHNADDADNERVFELENAKPINDPDCLHYFVKDDDKIGEYQGWICQKCKRGAYFPENTEIINS